MILFQEKAMQDQRETVDDDVQAVTNIFENLQTCQLQLDFVCSQQSH